MKLENQLVSLELATKLKELGVEQDSLFYWRVPGKGSAYAGVAILDYKPILAKTQSERDEFNFTSAYAVAELGEMLPKSLKKAKKEWWINCDWYRDGRCSIAYRTVEDKLFESLDDTEANARAKMLIYLKENKLI